MTTWDTAFNSGDAVTFSNGNLTVQSTGTTNIIARSSTSKASGKVYIEIDDIIGAASLGAGISTSAAPHSGTTLFSDTHSVCWAKNGNVTVKGTFVTAVAAYTTGDVLGFAIDFDAALIWFRKNNGTWNASGTADPSTGTGGISFSSITGPFYSTIGFFSLSGNKGTIDPAGSNYGAPSGFSTWDAGAGSVTASGGVNSTVPTLSGSGEVSIAGNGGVSAPAPTVSGSGTVGSLVDGSGAVNATVPTLSGSAIVSIAGTGSIDATTPTLDGTGDAVGGAVTGSGAISATVVQLHGVGSVVGGAKRGDDAGPRWAPRHVRPIRVIYQEEDVREALDEPTAQDAPKPTKAKKRKLVKDVEQKVLSAASLPAIFAPVVERVVSQEIGVAWKGPSDWEVLSAILNVAVQRAVEEIRRVQREIEDEDEMILLLAA